jgi:hypothetical protein
MDHAAKKALIKNPPEGAASIGEVQFIIPAPCRRKARFWFSYQMAEVVVSQEMFTEILRRIGKLRLLVEASG